MSSSSSSQSKIQEALLKTQNSRERNLRKLRLQLLFGPGLICVCGPPASGKTSLVAEIFGINSDTSANANSMMTMNDSASSSSTQMRDLETEALMMTSSCVLREEDNRRRQRLLFYDYEGGPFGSNVHSSSSINGNNNSSSSDHSAENIFLGRSAGNLHQLSTEQIMRNPFVQSLCYATPKKSSNNGSTVIAYISAASASSASHAIRRLGKEARRAVRVWSDLPSFEVLMNTSNNNNSKSSSSNNATNQSISSLMANSYYSATDSKSLEGAVAAASLDIKVAFEQMMAVIALRNKQGNTANSPTNLLHQRSNTFGAGDDVMEPPILHLVVDDVDLIEVTQRTSKGGGWGRGKADHDVDASGLGQQQHGSIAGGNWDSFDQAIESLFKNVSLSNYPARGKRLYDTQKHSSIVKPGNGTTFDLCTSAPILSVPETLAKSQSTTPAKAVAMRISSGIYIWVITQTPFESRCLFERTCFFTMPTTNEIYKEAARVARIALLQVRGMKNASLVSSTIINAAAAAGGASPQFLRGGNHQNENESFYDLEQLEKAACFYVSNAPTCHSLVVRDSRLLAARLVAIVQHLQKTTGVGKALPRLTPPVLARAWSSAASIEEQVGAARRDADNRQQQLLLQQQQLNENGKSNQENQPQQQQHQQQQPKRDVSSALVASMRCLPVAAQLLAVAAFCCGALSEATLKAVLGDTSGFVRQTRGGGGADGGRGSRMANSNFNNSHNFMTKFAFGPSTLAWTYDAIVRVATSIQEAKRPSSSTSNNKKNNNSKDDKNSNKKEGASSSQLTLGSCCWTPGKLSNCLPSGFLAQHHLLSLEALGAISVVRGTATTKYRCLLIPNDAASLAKLFEIDIWQLTTGASVRNA